mmetsp:Transcript_5560/g.9192  ORF Transcript_5560/g.9192 Transcript_5560/m.9192 type:complete len:228 (-) Transcript_5560:3-686(-)
MNPPNLLSNLRYVERYCSKQTELTGEAAYYHTNTRSAIQFLEEINVDSLNISQEEFIRNMSKSKSISTSTSTSNELPNIKDLNFIQHNMEDIKLSEVPLLLEEYKKLALWFVASIDKDNSVSLNLPDTIKWGKLLVKNNSMGGYKMINNYQQQSKIHDNSSYNHFSFEWLWKTICDTIIGKPIGSLSQLKLYWEDKDNIDIIIENDEDCTLIWKELLQGNDIRLFMK